jgi:hypothetical protein
MRAIGISYDRAGPTTLHYGAVYWNRSKPPSCSKSLWISNDEKERVDVVGKGKSSEANGGK